MKGFFLNPDGTSRLPLDDYLPTWHALRTDPAHATDFAARYPDPADRANETRAATKAAAHAETPTTTYLDTMGRRFLTVAHNRVVAPDHERDGTEEKLHTRVDLDIEGNQRAVRDAIEQDGDPLGRVVMRYDLDMLGNRIHQASMEAGERWMLHAVTGQPIRAWDSRGHEFRSDYDPLRRPRRSFVAGADPTDPARELLTDRLVYGEQHPEAEARNLRGTLYLALDQAGASSEVHDFKGNLLASTRRLARQYQQPLDWRAMDAALPGAATTILDPAALETALAPLLEADIYTSRTTFDALNRPTELTAPDSSVVRPTYNDANLLERVDVNLQGATGTTPFVTDIDYDAKGQRTLIEHGNGVRTAYDYHPLTFRLSHLQTVRGAEALQDLHYTYNPVGNIAAIRDVAQQTIFFRNQRVEPSAGYTYDALYQLIEATGREHLGQSGGQRNPPTPPDALNGFHTHLDHPGDGNAMGTYVERYLYDAVGNFLKMQHRGSDPAHPGWTRAYAYHEPSLLEPGKQSNRLSNTTVGMQNGQPLLEPYTHDAHGRMTHMPHLPLMEWDYRDQLQATATQVVNNGGMPEITYYIYDGAGQRTRKVTERRAAAGQTPTRKEERLYLGGFEVFREYDGSGATVALERETLHIVDDKQRIALVETRTQGTDASPPQLIRYQFGNHLGSASLELDDQAQVISYEEYYPYGSTSYQAVRSGLERNPKRYRYTGMERDEENGLDYHGARYYAPWLGRWVSCDPVGPSEQASESLYAAYAQNPIKFVDLTGKSPATPSTSGSDKQWPTVDDYTHNYGNAKPVPLREPESPAGGKPAGPLRRFFQKVVIVTSTILGGHTTDGNVPKLPIPPVESKETIERKAELEKERVAKSGAKKTTGGSSPPPGENPSAAGSGKQMSTVHDYTHNYGNAKPVASGEPGSPPGGGRRIGLGTGVAVGATLVVLLGQGSLKEKVRALAEGYALGWGVEFVASRFVGARLAGGPVGLVLGTVIFMCGDNGPECERQEREAARAKAEKALEGEITSRAHAIYRDELLKGNQPEWNIVLDMAVREKYVELGLDKVDEARRPRDPNKCYVQDDPFDRTKPLTTLPMIPRQTSMSRR